MSEIHFLVMDVDGTLTDGKIYMGVDGEVLKAFDIKDGYALHSLLKDYSIIPIIITARRSPMVEHRCKELGVTEIHQGVMNKLDCLRNIINRYSSKEQHFDLSNVAYIGDDLLDLQCIIPIKEAGGIAGCPSNAAKEVLSVCQYVAPYKGGDGAVRAFVEYIIDYNNNRFKQRSDLEKHCLEAVDYLSQLTGEALSIGRHDVNEHFYYNVQEYETDDNKEKPYESHCNHIDIQLLLSGEEIMQVTDIDRLKVCVQYDETKDCVFYHPSDNVSGIILRPGSVMLLYPKDGHRSVSVNRKKSRVKKIIGKIII